jgi:hypothetical protein
MGVDSLTAAVGLMRGSLCHTGAIFDKAVPLLASSAGKRHNRDIKIITADFLSSIFSPDAMGRRISPE